MSLKPATARILVVEDDQDLCDLLSVGLAEHGFTITTCTRAEAALAALAETDFAAILTDLNLPGMNGLEFSERVEANRPDIPVVVMTAYATLETAVGALRVGADDFLTKPLQINATAARLTKVIRTCALREEVKRLRGIVEGAEHFGDMLGNSEAMRPVYDLLERVANSDASVLITGESGTGKEVVARALHQHGQRANGPFVAVNCSAVPEHLLESELFGHTKGAFTDAQSDRAGLFSHANGGTLFLDEVGEMPLSVQPKILRALQERLVRPVGGDSELPIDVRVIAATNRDLESAIEDKTFREDLYFRINVIHVELPPLRARGRDVLVLAQQFLNHFAQKASKTVTQISPEAAEKLLDYDWPGNVRELQNSIERAVALARFENIAVDDLPKKVRNYERSHVIVTSNDPTELVTMDRVEARYITRVLEAVGGNKTAAAKTLGFDRKTLYRKLERYKIDLPEAEAETE